MSVLLGSWLAGVLVFAAAFSLPFPVGGFPGSRKGYLYSSNGFIRFSSVCALACGIAGGCARRSASGGASLWSRASFA